MAPFYKAAAAFCLVGLCWFQSEAAEEKKYIFEVAPAEEDAYLTAKLARNGKITAKTNTVEKDPQLVSSLQGKVGTSTEDTNAACTTLMTDDLKKLFHHAFEYTEEHDYRQLVQDAVTAGLEEFGKTYPADSDAWKQVWKKEKARSMMHLLGASSTKIGCVIANEDYFKELSTRTTELKSMTDEDLKDPIVTSSADATVPSILTAGLVAILAAISA
ncbi:uncharacterized protein EMH_0097260 [Eimeria mitis]|uniref:SAG family member n=1 Tax=Eimeria mitis TaxID=44415 RepID=U6KFR3_9EIME|nr:uncharacterized protein EMH_0097260 [Eimeria mitis]CDJ36840.1 hypothetical protein, conserved [Eimeria mitis]